MRAPIVNHQPVVYYMTSEHGGVVKIGTTVNMPLRMKRFNRRHTEVTLTFQATEPGGLDVEKRRHKQFAHLNQVGEWFWLTPELQAWIDGLKA